MWKRNISTMVNRARNKQATSSTFIAEKSKLPTLTELLDAKAKLLPMDPRSTHRWTLKIYVHF